MVAQCDSEPDAVGRPHIQPAEISVNSNRLQIRLWEGKGV